MIVLLLSLRGDLSKISSTISLILLKSNIYSRNNNCNLLMKATQQHLRKAYLMLLMIVAVLGCSLTFSKFL